MIITGIEIIRGTRATYRCECIECGYLLESAEHCSGLLCPRCGGQMRRAERPGPGEPRSTGVAPPGKLTVLVGETVRVTLSVDYRGSAISGAKIHISFGQKDTLFNEDGNKQGDITNITFGPDSDWKTYTFTKDILIGGSSGTNYDLYAKIMSVPGADIFTPTYLNVLDVIDITTFELLEETIYPYAYVYNGPYEGGVFTFKTDPFTPASWIAGRFADLCEDKVREQGWRVLETKVYVDKSPLLWTDWRIEIKAVAPEGTAVALGGVVAVLVMVLLIILGLIGLIVAATWAWKEIFGTHKAKPIDEEIKKGMSRKWLTLTIGEFEERLIAEGKIPGPPTPPEELEQMSDQELRDYCDQLAELVVPPVPPVPGLGIAIAAVGVLGLGALAAMAMARPAEEGHER